MITKAAIPHVPDSCDVLAVSGEEAARLLALSGRTWRRLDAQGLVPRAVRIGRSRRWSVAELRDWVEADCPARECWEQTKKVAGGCHGQRRQKQGHKNDYKATKLPPSTATACSPSAAGAAAARPGLAEQGGG